MITSVDKFLTAVIGAALFALSEWGGINFGIGESQFQTIVSFATTVLVYAVPNLKT